MWDGKVVFKKPPPVPTVKTYGRTKDEALLAQRQAAYDVADAERTEAHNRWVAKNGDRKKERDKIRHAEYDSKRDWVDEADDREKAREEEEEETRPVRPSEVLGMHPWKRERLESLCTAEDGDCDCVLCVGRRLAAAEQARRWNAQLAAMAKTERAREDARETLEVEVRALQAHSPQELARVAPPSEEELQIAEEYVQHSAHPPRKVSPRALLQVRMKHDVTAALETIICEVEKLARMEALEPMERERRQRSELYLWSAKFEPTILDGRQPYSESELESWRGEVEAVCRYAGTAAPVWCSSPGFIREESDAWIQGLECYLRFCIPRQHSSTSPLSWPQEWPRWPNEWQHQWPADAEWPSEWWTSLQLTRHLQKLALVGCILKPAEQDGDGPPDYNTWVAQGPSWLVKGRRARGQTPYHPEFTRASHAEICGVWMDREECDEVESAAFQMQVDWLSLGSFCQHVPWPTEEATAEQLCHALGIGVYNRGVFPFATGKPRGIRVGGYRNTGKCASCFQEMVGEIIAMRFVHVPGESMDAWLDQLAEEERFITLFQNEIRLLWQHNSAVRSLQRKREEKVSEAREQAAEEARRKAAAEAREQRHFEYRSRFAIAVEAEAAASGRPRITPANAAEWEPPDFRARDGNGECIYFVESRAFHPSFGSMGALSTAEYEALPECERVLCQRDRCTHKSEFPICRRHCRCPGFRKLTREITDGSMTVDDDGSLVARKRTVTDECRADCRYLEVRSIQRWKPLSAPIIWYWQMTGDTFYGDSGTSGYDLAHNSLETELRFINVHETRYQAQVEAWRTLRGGASSSGMKTAGGKRKLAGKSL